MLKAHFPQLVASEFLHKWASSLIVIGIVLFGGIIPMISLAQAPFPAREVSFERLGGKRANDSNVYVIYGSGWLRAMMSPDMLSRVKSWLALHPKAVATPIASQIIGADKARLSIYVWIEDGEETLNEYLVRNGIVPGDVMIDVVEYSILGNTALAHDDQLGLKQSQAHPNSDPDGATENLGARRLIAEEEYQLRMRRVFLSEGAARAEKLGIWADQFSEQRGSVGLPKRSGCC